MTKVKVCGITRKGDLEFAINAGVDALGFVVGVPKSPRNLTNKVASELISLVPKEVQSTIVTTMKSDSELREVCEELKASAIQLYGLKEYPGFLKSEYGLRVIGAVEAESVSALDSARAASKVCDGILVDSSLPGIEGGTGELHDWKLSSMIRANVSPLTFYLAGGLTPNNVSEAIRVVKPDYVDVSTGVEVSPGVKDPSKVSNFIDRAKGVI